MANVNQVSNVAYGPVVIISNIVDHTRTICVLNCPDVWSYSKRELNKLKAMLVKITHAQFDDILVSGVKSGCVIVTFKIRNCLIPTLRALYTPHKMAYQWMLKLPLKHKILKVMIEDEVIYMSGMSVQYPLICNIISRKIH